MPLIPALWRQTGRSLWVQYQQSLNSKFPPPRATEWDPILAKQNESQTRNLTVSFNIIFRHLSKPNIILNVGDITWWQYISLMQARYWVASLAQNEFFFFWWLGKIQLLHKQILQIHPWVGQHKELIGLLLCRWWHPAGVCAQARSACRELLGKRKDVPRVGGFRYCALTVVALQRGCTGSSVCFKTMWVHVCT